MIKKIVFFCILLVLFYYFGMNHYRLKSVIDAFMSNERYVQNKCNINDSLSVTLYFNNNRVSSIDLYNNITEKTYYYGLRDGLVSIFSEYVRGKQEGLNMVYYSDGRLCIRNTFRNNKIDGFYEHFSENGNLLYKSIYVDGIEDTVLIDIVEEIEEIKID